MAQLNGKQILDASIAIAKLAFGVLRPDVAVTWTVNQDAGSQRLTNLGAPTAGTDAARLQDVQNIPWKQSADVATTANITLSGEQTIDGVATSTSRVLVKDQSTGSQNGVYISAAGAWARASDFDSTTEVQGAVIHVNGGTTNGDKRFAQTTNNVTVGTTAMVFVDIGSGGAAAYPVTSNKDMTAAVTTADFDDACVTTVATTPSGDGYVQVFVNGVKYPVGDGVRTKACYFSADGGTTARAISAIAAGDTLYWVGSVAGFELAATDRIDFDYSV